MVNIRPFAAAGLGLKQGVNVKQNWQRFLLFGVIVVLVAGAAVLRPMAAAPQLTSDDRAALEKLNRHFVEAIELVRENYLATFSGA